MRKILAVTLAVLMLASLLLVLPTSAATPADGTTEADIPTLMVTEMVSNSSCGIKKTDNAKKEYDAFEYIELYNRGDSEINLYNYSILRSPFFTSAPSSGIYTGTWNKWKSTQKFTQKMNIVSGDITTKPDDVAIIDAFSNVELKNPADLRIAARGNAVIFVVTQTTLDALTAYMSNLGGMNSNPDILRTLFRNYYNVPATVPIYMVWGYSDGVLEGGNTVAARDMFNLSDCTNKTSGFMYGISTNDFNIDDEKAYDKTAHTINPKIACLFAYGANVYGHTGGTPNQNQSVIYVPANTTPVLWNARNEYRNSNVDPFTDYFASTAIPSIVNSYRECATMLNAMKPTCGTMPAYQWYYVDAEHAPAEMKAVGTDWGDKAVAAFVAERFPNLDEEAENYQPAEGEPDVKLDFVDRQELTDRFFGKKNKKDNSTDKGLPIGAIIGIVAGGVVVLGGIATLVIVLVMKKKKAAAAVDATETDPDASSDQDTAQPTENAGEDRQD